MLLSRGGGRSWRSWLRGWPAGRTIVVMGLIVPSRLLLRVKNRRHGVAGPGLALVLALLLAACGTFRIEVEAPAGTGSPSASPASGESVRPAETVPARAESIEAVAWFGQVKSVNGADPTGDYLKLWHLAIWPKLGRAVGITAADPTLAAEIARITDRDVSAYFWGEAICNVSDYGGCQLRVTALSPTDGGSRFEPQAVSGWEGRLGVLPGPTASATPALFLVLDQIVPVLYGVRGSTETLQAELVRLAGEGATVRAWGQVSPRQKPSRPAAICSWWSAWKCLSLRQRLEPPDSCYRSVTDSDRTMTCLL